MTSLYQHPERRRIFLMRHAEAEYIRPDGSLAPDERLVPLTARGREQAQVQAGVLKDVNFDRAICSGLRRTLETAGILLEHHPHLKLETKPAMEEIHPGKNFSLEGLSREEQAQMVQRIANPWAIAGEPDARFLGGERFQDFADRVLPAWQSIIDDLSWSTILLVMHGAVNRLLLNTLLNVPWQDGVSIEQDNCCINIIDIDHAPKPHVLVRKVNFTGYNPTKDGIYLTNMEQTAARMAEELTDSGAAH